MLVAVGTKQEVVPGCVERGNIFFKITLFSKRPGLAEAGDRKSKSQYLLKPRETRQR